MKKIISVFLLVLSFGLIFPADADAANRRIRSVPAKKRAVLRPSAIRRMPNIITASAGGLVGQPVPFTIQAPRNTWGDARFKDACEEASVLMAVSWVQGRTITVDYALEEIKKMAVWENEHIGSHVDTSIADTARLIKEYYQMPLARVQRNIGVDDIARALAAHKIAIVAVDGSRFYTPGGPPRHMVVVTGYDFAKEEFIINDPIFANGGGLRVQQQVLAESLRDYPSGVHKPVKTRQTAMITVDWPWAN